MAAKRTGGKFDIDRGLTVIRDTTLEFQPLYMEVYVAGDALERRAFAEMFIRARCTKADKPENADLVVFTGGPDVNPAFYGEVRHQRTSVSPQRDDEDQATYNLCYSEGIPMFGVCRGAQFLQVMNGGKLFQDVDNHYGDHSMWDIKNKLRIQRVSSVHHQSVIPDRSLGMEVIAESYTSKTRWKNPTDKDEGYFADVEAFFYPDTCSFGVQGHPEYKGYYQYLQWTIKMIDDLICANPDIALRGNYRRLKEGVIQQREAMIAEKVKELN